MKFETAIMDNKYNYVFKRSSYSNLEISFLIDIEFPKEIFLSRFATSPLPSRVLQLSSIRAFVRE